MAIMASAAIIAATAAWLRDSTKTPATSMIASSSSET